MSDKNPPLQARDKLTFLLSLVPYLMDHDHVSVSEAAEHFGVSKSHIREAVRLIAVSGIPGDTATYQHGDLFDIAWDDFEENDQIVLTNLVAIDESPRLSGREAAALLAGLQYLSALPEYADRSAIAVLMAKLAGGASSALSEVAVEASDTDATLKLVRDAVASGRQIEFVYLNSREVQEQRKVDPLRVESVDADWYLRAWCHLRGALRTFRLDRIRDANITAEKITFHAEDVVLPESIFEGSPDDISVELEISPAALPLVSDFLIDAVTVEQPSGVITAIIPVSNVNTIKRMASSAPGLVTVLSPPEARELVAEWARKGAARYESQS
ncbi:MAG: WYL domain-containing protein [Terrimesophilobacter sp.]